MTVELFIKKLNRETRHTNIFNPQQSIVWMNIFLTGLTKNYAHFIISGGGSFMIENAALSVCVAYELHIIVGSFDVKKFRVRGRDLA